MNWEKYLTSPEEREADAAHRAEQPLALRVGKVALLSGVFYGASMGELMIARESTTAAAVVVGVALAAAWATVIIKIKRGQHESEPDN